MLQPLLFIHSWLRWVIFIALIFFFFRCLVGWLTKKPWKSSDTKFVFVFDQLLGSQILLGIILWLAASPLTRSFMQNPSIIFENKVISFFAVKHGVWMILALGALHMGKAKARKNPDEKKFKIFTIIFGVILALVIAGIPWPWLVHGRNFFNWSF